MNIEIGTVKTIVGKFWIQHPNGEMHLAVVGEMIHSDDRIIGSSANTANSTLSLDLVGNSTKDIVLAANDVLAVDQTFLKDILVREDASIRKASLVAAWDGESENISIKIEDNKDALALGDTEVADGETAAGGAATDGQSTPANFDSRTGTITDVTTGLTTGTIGGVNSTFTGTNTIDLNDQPVVFDTTVTVNEKLDGSNTITGQLVAFDADPTDTHQFFLFGGPRVVDSRGIDVTVGDLTLNLDGTFEITGDFNHLADGEIATITFQYYAVDNGLPTGAPHDSLPATVTLTVTGTNDQPIVSDVNVNGTGSGEVVGLDTLANTMATFNYGHINNYHEAFIATQSELSKIEMEYHQLGSVVTSVKVNLVEVLANGTLGAVLYSSIETTLSSNNLVVDNLGFILEVGKKYAISVQHLNAGQSSFDYDFSGPVDNQGIYENGLFLDWAEIGMKLTYGSGATVILETNGVEIIHEGKLALTTDLDTTDKHTFQLVDKSATVVTNGGSRAVVTDLAVKVAADGTYKVIGNFDALAAGETATVTFQYTATDDSGTANAVSEPKTVTLTVTGTNDQPIVTAVTETATETNGVEIIHEGKLALTTDLDTTDKHTFQLVDKSATVVTNGGSRAVVTDLAVKVAADGTYKVIGNFDALADTETATVTFQYTATDDSGTANAISEPKTVTLTVTGTNDAPVAIDHTFATLEDTSVTYTVAELASFLLQGATDVDVSDTLTVNSITMDQSNSDKVSYVVNSDGTVTFTPAHNYSGEVTFTYTVTDGMAVSAPVTVTINVTPVADAPSLRITAASKVLISENFEEITIVPNKADNNYMYSNTVPVGSLTGSTWTTANKSGLLEIGQQKLYVGGTGTSNVIELERNASDYSLETKFTTAKGLHTLSLDYSPRTGRTGADSQINVYVDGTLVKVLTSTIVGMATYTVLLSDLAAGTHTLRFESFNKNSIGGVLDNITLTEAQNTGLAGQAIYLSAIEALPSADSTETFTLTMSGIPNGFILSDGTAANTVTGDGTTVDITGWNPNTLIVTPPSTATGVTVDLTVTATSTESDGTVAQEAATIELTVLPSAGNDTIIFDSLYKSIDGGAGTDTLVLSVKDTVIDFSALGDVIHNIEIIDLSQNGAHTLDKLTVQDVLDMTDSTTHDLIILGTTEDTVNLQNTTGGVWTANGQDTTTIAGHTLDIYINSFDPTVQVKIEQSVTEHII